MMTIAQKYQQLGGANGVLGGLVGSPLDGGQIQVYTKGRIYLRSGTDVPYEVHGSILARLLALAPTLDLGYPVSDETVLADGRGRANRCEGGHLYWHPDLGVHEVHGFILAKFMSLGGTSYLGYPTTDEANTADNLGKISGFQNGVVVYRNNLAFAVMGLIRGRWEAKGGVAGLGYPLTDELPGPGDDERYSRFDKGVIVWSPKTGIREAL